MKKKRSIPQNVRDAVKTLAPGSSRSLGSFSDNELLPKCAKRVKQKKIITSSFVH